VWESRVYWGKKYQEVKLCSTLKPRETMGPGPRYGYKMTSTIFNPVHYNMSSRV
jgi:hypothetical protein